MDAYTGDVQFYIFDDEDAIIQTFSSAFPDLFKTRDEMPESLLSHVRYPRDFFSVQAEKYLLYHMRDTTDFYRKEDPWSIPQELFFETVQPIQPYHVIMKLPGEEKEEFVLMLPFTPFEQAQPGRLAGCSHGQRSRPVRQPQGLLLPKGASGGRTGGRSKPE